MLHGRVVNTAQEPLPGATVHWMHQPEGSVADEQGRFVIAAPDNMGYLVTTFVGYRSDTAIVSALSDSLEIILSEGTDLQTVEISGRRGDNFVSTLSTLNVESVTSKELRKAPCCSLAESFETNAAVDVQYNDAITGAKEVQVLGLRGMYSQTMLENRPTLGGLSVPFAFEYIPGTWLESIQIAKGSGTVINGYQGITGQINAELVKPFKDAPFFLNLFAGLPNRGEVNVHLNRKLNDRWSTGLLLHGSTVRNTHDHDPDGFYDMPQRNTLNGLYRLFYQGDQWMGQLNVHAVRDRREGGQLATGDRDLPYVTRQNNDRLEVFGKLAYLGFRKPYNGLGFIASATTHHLDAAFGRQPHQGSERSLYANLIYNTIIKTTDTKLQLGASYMADDYAESYRAVSLDRNESVPGVFGELNWTYVNPAKYIRGKKAWFSEMGLLAGLRLDQHNLYGLLITPRLNWRLSFTDEAIFRLSAGRGFRAPYLFAENINLLISNRDIVVPETLSLEEAWNMGANFTRLFDIGGKHASIAIDYYHTRFVNQIIVDQETDFSRLLFYNNPGPSYAHNFLVMATYMPVPGLDLRLAYKYNEVQMTYSDLQQRARPLVARHRGLAAWPTDPGWPGGFWMVPRRLLGRNGLLVFPKYRLLTANVFRSGRPLMLWSTPNLPIA